MSPLKILGVVLIVLGAAALAYGGFSYTKESHETKIGPLQLSLKEKEDVQIPKWAGLIAVGAGVLLLVAGNRRK